MDGESHGILLLCIAVRETMQSIVLNGNCSVKGWRVNTSKMDLPSLSPSSADGCGRLQLGVAHCSILVALLN